MVESTWTEEQARKAFLERESDQRRMSIALSEKNVTTKTQLKNKKEVICALCQSILFEPWMCKKCKNRFHKHCLSKFVKETQNCPFMCVKPKFANIKNDVES